MTNLAHSETGRTLIITIQHATAENIYKNIDEPNILFNLFSIQIQQMHKNILFFRHVNQCVDLLDFLHD